MAAELDAAQIRLVVNADDFGMSQSISRGVLRAHRDGIVTSTSLLGNCADIDGARALLAEAPSLGVGVHLALVQGTPVADPASVRSLLGPDGRFRPSGADFIAAWTKRNIVAEEVEREFDAQVARVRAAGITIDHLDTHHHLGFLPVVGRSVETVARRHGIGGIRSAVERADAVVGDRPAPRHQGRRADRPGLADAPAARRRRHGAQSWGYVESGRLDEVRVLEIIGRLGPGTHELICHPGEESTPVLRPRGRAGRADLGQGAPRAWPARHRAVPLGGPVLSEPHTSGTTDTAAAPLPEPYVPADKASPSSPSRRSSSGALFGIIFGASTVYLALKAGLTVSASIPIAVLSISLLKRLGKSTILENNIVQTIGSAGESIAAGVVFTLPGFLFLSRDPATGQSVGEPYFSYWTILTLALVGGVLGVLMMIPLRRVADRQGARDAALSRGDGVRVGADRRRARRQPGANRVPRAWASRSSTRSCRRSSTSSPRRRRWRSSRRTASCRRRPSAARSRPSTWASATSSVRASRACWSRAACSRGSGSSRSSRCSTPPDAIAAQLVKLGYLAGVGTAGGPGGWDPATHAFANAASAVYRAYVRQIGAGAVAAGGFITLLKTLPTIVGVVQGEHRVAAQARRRRPRPARRAPSATCRSPSCSSASLVLVLVIAVLPFVPGAGIGSKLLLGVLIVVFGFFFVTVASRIVGLIGSSSNPISGMTIATLMATCLVFVGLGWTGDVYQPMALCVGGMVCIAAANAGRDVAGSQDRLPRRRDAARAADRSAHRRRRGGDRRRADRAPARQPPRDTRPPLHRHREVSRRRRRR